jgi:hypothetical protein
MTPVAEIELLKVLCPASTFLPFQDLTRESMVMITQQEKSLWVLNHRNLVDICLQELARNWFSNVSLSAV